jgi:hypothetical protein
VAFKPWLEAEDVENVWDTPAQRGVIVHLAKAAVADERGHLIAEITYARLGAKLNVDERYVQRIVEQLALDKLALVPIGGRSKGSMGRYALTLERCYAKVRLEAGVAPDFPLERFSELPSRHAILVREGRRKDKSGRRRRAHRVDPGIETPADPGIYPVGVFNSSSTEEAYPGIGKTDPGVPDSDPGIANADPGIYPVPTDSEDLRLKDKEGRAARAPNLPLFGLTPPTVDQVVAVERQELKDKLLARVKALALEALEQADPPIASREALEAATLALCVARRLPGAFQEHLAGVVASVWLAATLNLSRKAEAV